MRNKKLKSTNETEAGFALIVILTNFLIFAVLSVAGWAIAGVINGDREFHIFFRGGFMS